MKNFNHKDSYKEATFIIYILSGIFCGKIQIFHVLYFMAFHLPTD